MVTKLKKSSAGKPEPDASGASGASGGSGRSRRPQIDSAQLAGTIKDSAQHIWLAGLGAFAKAQAEGGKVFETLVREGVSLQRKTQSAAEDKITEATSRMATMATGLSSKASGQWDKLESIFEERVSRALNKLGVPSAKDIDELIARIEELNRSVARLQAARSGGAAKPAKATQAAPAEKAAPEDKPARRPAAPRKRAAARKPAE